MIPSPRCVAFPLAILVAAAACGDRATPASDTDVNATAPSTEGESDAPETVLSGTRAPAPTFIGAYLHGPLDSIYNAEYQRVGALCAGEAEACWSDNLDGTAVALTPYWLRPDGGEPDGWLSVRLRTQGRWPYASLVARASEGNETTVMEDLGDWGYGMTMPVRETRGDRFQPWLLSNLGAWLPMDGGPGFSVLEGPYGLDGRLWSFPPIDASPVGGGDDPIALPAGAYMVLGVEDGVVRFRAEIPQDMPCGDELDPGPASEPLVYVAPVDALMDADGRPVVEVAYARGC